MTRWGLACAVVVAVAAGVWWRREPAQIIGPAVVPLGEVVQQILPGPDGEPEVWTLKKRDAVREEEITDDLPEPEPRQAPPDAATESARALDAQALEAWKHGDIHGALKAFKDAIAADPDDWVPRSDYARLLVLMTAYADAEPHLERAAELNPDSPRVWLDLYSYYERTLQIERALGARRRAEDLAGDQAIVQDPPTGLWRLENDSIYP